jgi:ABC-type multidrug transport system fused ATPase/permease subunit
MMIDEILFSKNKIKNLLLFFSLLHIVNLHGTIHHATEILVLEHGLIVQRHTPKTLLVKKGLYAQLVQEATR